MTGASYSTSRSVPSASVEKNNGHLSGVLRSLVICDERAWPLVSSQYDTAIIRSGVSRVCLQVLGWSGQRSVRMGIEFYSLCSESQGQSEDTRLSWPLDPSSAGILLILGRVSTVMDG